jgi:hypothetical protein
MEPQAAKQEGGKEARPEFERVADVLGPLEQIVLAADQEIGSLQHRVDDEAGDMSTRVDRRVREAALEQRQRVVEMKSELTDAASQLATRFETMLDILDQAERQLAMQGLPEGEADRGGVRVTLTERRRVTISHEGPPSSEPETKQPESKPPPVVSASAKDAQAKDAPSGKRKGIRRLWRRVRGSSS